MKKITLSVLLFLASLTIYAQDTLRVLFIGNSYTAVNNLPEVVKNIAASDGNALQYSVSAPGGFTFQQHCTYPPTVNLIQQGNWDYVVLQEQSQTPAFPDAQVATDFYPYAERLDSLVHAYTPCAKTVFYVTWGRKFGDQQNGQFYPPIGTYEGMDSLLTLRYTNIADSVHAYLSPVGPLWHYIRDNNPALELYQSDNSHPSFAGTYAAALSFYSVLFHKDVQNINYNYSLSVTDAAYIRNAAQQIVSDSLNYWYRFNPSVVAAFETGSDSLAGVNIGFVNQSENASGYFWDFGDGQTDTSASPVHVFQQPGDYQVCLTAYKACDTVQFCDTVQIGSLGIHENQFAVQAWIYPNPTKGLLHLKNVPVGSAYFISDLTGRKLQSGMIGDTKSILVNKLTTGLYFLYLKTPKGFAVLKFHKQP